MTALGVYLHFPWCRKLCPYCDFAVEVGAPPHDEYLDAILAELDQRAPAFAALGDLVSIYFGGGTPSLWRVDCIARAIAAVRDAFAARGDLEVTLEANPTDCSDEVLAGWRRAGVTRVSIGVQSFHADELVVLGRDHRFGDGRVAITSAIAAGLHVSADFIFGTPIAAAREEERRVDGPLTPRVPTVADLALDHLSIYELTIEDRTAFGARVRDGRLVPHDEDALYATYVATHDALVARGWEHYEISSYARPNRRAVHNSLYWQGAPYLGLGVGAASLYVAGNGSGERVTNPRRAVDYLREPGRPAERAHVTAPEMAIDRMWLGMRTCDGVEDGALPALLADQLVDDGLAERQAGRIRPTLRGFLMADRVAARIVASL